MPKVSEAYLKERRRQILEAAIVCFARKGFYETTMEDIGNEAGVSPGVAYRYFENKDAIIEATFTSGLERWGHFLTDMQAGDFMQGLDDLTQTWFIRFEQPGVDTYFKVRMKMMTEYAQDSPRLEKYRQIYETGLDLYETAIRHGQDMGQINADLNPRALARILDALFNGFVLQWLVDPSVNIWQYREAMLALLRCSPSRPYDRDSD